MPSPDRCLHRTQDLYQAATYLRMYELTKKLREHCLTGTSADASYEQLERMLACLIARCVLYLWQRAGAVFANVCA